MIIGIKNFLSTCNQILQTSNTSFISSDQIEVMTDGTIVGVNDFPTPSGWLLNRKKMNSIPFFNETYRWHLDNEYLGQLNKCHTKRCHLLERYAPHSLDVAARSRVGLVRLPRTVTKHKTDTP